MDGLSDAEIEERLRAAPEARWSELWEAVVTLEAEHEHGRWEGGQPVDTIVVDGVERPVLQMPYVVYGEAVQRVIACIYALGANLPFDWNSWAGLNRYPGGRGLETVNVAEAVRLVTAIVRADRFFEGTLLTCVDDGTFSAITTRLRRWHEQEGTA